MIDEDDDGRRNFRSKGSLGIESAVPARSRMAHHEDEKKSFDIDENELI